VYRVRDDREACVLLTGAGTTMEWTPVLPRSAGLVGLAVRDARTAVSRNVLEDARLEFTPDVRARIERGRYRSGLAVPLIVKGEVIGALLVGGCEERVFDDDETRVAEAFATQAALALENARLFAATEEHARALAHKNAELDGFVYSVSHDLKTPLVTIQGMASLLLEDHAASLPSEGRHYVERIDANTRHMERLLLDILALSRVGREARARELVDVDDLVAQLLDDLDERIRSRGVTVTVHPLPAVWAIPTQIEQVLANLLGNALKYLGQAETPTVEVGAIERDDAIEYYVRDSGIGIDPAYHAKVFEVFQRLRDVEVEGTGVGLAIVKKIVDGNGGRLWVESARGAGATFRFTWPRPSAERLTTVTQASAR
jgi:signal transduction histidine kinase